MNSYYRIGHLNNSNRSMLYIDKKSGISLMSNTKFKIPVYAKELKVGEEYMVNFSGKENLAILIKMWDGTYDFRDTDTGVIYTFGNEVFDKGLINKYSYKKSEIQHDIFTVYNYKDNTDKYVTMYFGLDGTFLLAEI